MKELFYIKFISLFIQGKITERELRQVLKVKKWVFKL